MSPAGDSGNLYHCKEMHFPHNDNIFRVGFEFELSAELFFELFRHSAKAIAPYSIVDIHMVPVRLIHYLVTTNEPQDYLFCEFSCTRLKFITIIVAFTRSVLPRRSHFSIVYNVSDICTSIDSSSFAIHNDRTRIEVD